jgi:CBS domain-containing protein
MSEYLETMNSSRTCIVCGVVAFAYSWGHLWWILRRLQAFENRMVALLSDKLKKDRTSHIEKSVQTQNPGEKSAYTKHAASDSENDIATSEYVCIRRGDKGIFAFGSDLASQWVYDRAIVSVNEHETAAEALVAMYENHSSCAIVKGDRDEFLGMVDLLDVVRYILRGDKFESPTVRRMLRLCVVASDTALLSDVCEHLVAGNRHVAIAHPDGKHQIVSQRSVIQKLVHDDAQLLRTKLKDANLPSWNRVINAYESWTARKAFESMVAYDITSLPVCDDETRAVDVISASDILHTCRTNFNLDKTIKACKEDSRTFTKKPALPSTLISCTPDDTLAIALEKMLNENIHHVYVLDVHGSPVGVVSFVDVLRML